MLVKFVGAQEVILAPGADGGVFTPAFHYGAGFSVVVKFDGTQEVLLAPGADGGVFTLAFHYGADFSVVVKFDDAQKVLLAPGADGVATPAATCGAALPVAGSLLTLRKSFWHPEQIVLYPPLQPATVLVFRWL